MGKVLDEFSGSAIFDHNILVIGDCFLHVVAMIRDAGKASSKLGPPGMCYNVMNCMAFPMEGYRFKDTIREGYSSQARTVTETDKDTKVSATTYIPGVDVPPELLDCTVIKSALDGNVAEALPKKLEIVICGVMHKYQIEFTWTLENLGNNKCKLTYKHTELIKKSLISRMLRGCVPDLRRRYFKRNFDEFVEGVRDSALHPNVGLQLMTREWQLRQQGRAGFVSNTGINAQEININLNVAGGIMTLHSGFQAR